MAAAGTVPASRRAMALAGAALCVVALAGCGSSTPNAPSTSSASSATTAAASPAGSAGAGSSGAAGKTTLTGTIEAGVETGCFVLVDENGTVLANLVDVDTVVAPAGSVVEVTGTFEDMMTICQQGKPFSLPPSTFAERSGSALTDQRRGGHRCPVWQRY